MKCVRCQKEVKGGVCSWCLLDHTSLLPETNPVYLVYVELAHRIVVEGTRREDQLVANMYRVVATARELVLLKHGNRIFLNGVLWQIRAINSEAGTIWLTGDRWTGKLLKRSTLDRFFDRVVWKKDTTPRLLSGGTRLDDSAT